MSDSQISKVLIVIGSAQESYTLKNPFTSGERFEMLLATIQKEKTISADRYLIIPIPDLKNNNQWLAYIQSMLPRFSRIYSNNPLIRNLVKSFSDKQHYSIPLKNRKLWSSSEIRQRILNNELWEELVPLAVKELINEFDGVKRIQSLNVSDET